MSGGDYSKFKYNSWNNFLDKVNSYKEVAPDYWNHYQLLGYFNDRIGVDLEYLDGYSPSHHPQITQMKYMIAIFLGYDFNRCPTKKFDSMQIKHFLDWCLSILEENKIAIHSLKYISNNKNLPKWIFLYKNDSYIKPKMTIDFDPSKLDIGDYE